jgi:AAHS family benzoate transporter-like MFS transporter
LAFAAVVFEGYDLILFGFAVPALMVHPKWQLSPAQVGLLALAVVGMFFGAIGVGAVTNRIGSRWRSSDAWCGSR